MLYGFHFANEVESGDLQFQESLSRAYVQVHERGVRDLKRIPLEQRFLPTESLQEHFLP